MKSILFVIDGLGIGGAESHLVSLLNVFDYKKYKVDLLMYRRNGELEKYVPDQVNYLPVPGFFQHPPAPECSVLRYMFSRLNFGFGRRLNVKRQKPFHHAQFFWKCYRTCFKLIRKKYNAAVAFGQGFPCYFVAEKVVADIKLLSLNTDIHVDGYRKDFDTVFFREFTTILSVTNTLKNIISEHDKSISEKLAVFENTFNLDFIKNLARSEKAFTDDYLGIRIVSVGRLAPAKGFDLAIKSAHIMKQHRIDFKWYLVGGGYLQEELTALIHSLGLEGMVFITGQQLNPFKYYNEADLYVQTSRYEGFCRTLREAKVFRLPILSTNFSVVHEQITHGINGLIVGMDEHEIARGIELLIADKDLQQSLRKNIEMEPFTTSDEEFKKFEKYLIGQ